MATVNVSEAKASLSQLVERVLDGEDITIGRRGKAEVRLVAVARATEPRRFGVVDAPGYWMSDDFDAPLAAVEDDFEGNLDPS